MPRVTIYPAYSLPSMPNAWQAEGYLTFDVPEATTAHKLKALVGHAPSSWLYVRLNPHEPTKRCPCWGCDAARKGYLKRIPGWREPLAWMHRFVRLDIMARNAKLSPQDGERYVVVAQVDVRKFLTDLQSNLGRFGAIMALPALLELAALGETD